MKTKQDGWLFTLSPAEFKKAENLISYIMDTLNECDEKIERAKKRKHLPENVKTDLEKIQSDISEFFDTHIIKEK
jgi:hypothetical protein